MATAAPAKKATGAKSKPAAAEDSLPTREEAREAFVPALTPDLARVRSLLASLKSNPPQLIHLEGGLGPQRFALGLWWHALLNCDAPDESGEPCLACPVCLRAGARLHTDLLLLDGREESIKIGDVRALRPLLGELPRHGRVRLVMLAEAHALTLESANSLLKVLEDPCPGTVFAFTVPQREKLLPTLVSRGFVLTLPWPDPDRPLEGRLAEWEDALAGFVLSGTGWFGKSAAKGAVDAALAQEIVLLLQKALAGRLAGRRGGPLAAALARAPEQNLPGLDELAARCQEAIQDKVNPVLVMDYLASQAYLLARG